MNRNLLLSNLYAPDDSAGGSDTVEETFELLNTEDEGVKEEVLELDSKPAEDSEEDEEEVDELKELEEELKGPKEEDINELVTPVRRKEILAKYPKLFKDFPYLEKAYYREQQFTEILPTIQDARTAVDKARALDQTERQVMNGDLTGILAATKQESQEAFNKLADNYLPALRHVDQQAYYHVLGNVVKDTIITMVREGKQLGDQGSPLIAAANILNQFVFGSQNFAPPTNLSRNARPEEQNREQEIQRQDQERFYSNFTSARDDLQMRADNVLRSTIDGHIDPNGTMTDYVKGHASQEAFATLEDLINKDTRFRTLLDKLWEKSFQDGLSKDSLEKIKSAYLSKAKTLLPSVIKKARNDALRGLGSRRSEERDMTPKKSPTSNGTGKSTPPSSGRIRKPSDIPKGMSTLDILMKD